MSDLNAPSAHVPRGVVCGIDVGGTKVLGLLTTPDGHEPLATSRRPTPESGTELVGTIVEVVEALLAEVGDVELVALGAGVAGLIDGDGRVRYSPNMPGVVEFPLGAQLEARLGVPVRVENDATAAAWAEASFGSGQGLEHVVFVALGTGIGAGFVSHGRLIRGAHGFAGEIGHMTVDIDGPRHVTGARGPWEYFASGTALSRLGREAAAAGRFEAGIHAAGSADQVTGEVVASEIASGDSDALLILSDFGREVARGLASMIYTFDPEVIVIGGGVADIGAPLVGAVEMGLTRELLGRDHRPAVTVVTAGLGEPAGALGAADLALKMVPGASGDRQ